MRLVPCIWFALNFTMASGFFEFFSWMYMWSFKRIMVCFDNGYWIFWGNICGVGGSVELVPGGIWVNRRCAWLRQGVEENRGFVGRPIRRSTLQWPRVQGTRYLRASYSSFWPRNCTDYQLINLGFRFSYYIHIWIQYQWCFFLASPN